MPSRGASKSKSSKSGGGSSRSSTTKHASRKKQPSKPVQYGTKYAKDAAALKPRSHHKATRPDAKTTAAAKKSSRSVKKAAPGTSRSLAAAGKSVLSGKKGVGDAKQNDAAAARSVAKGEAIERKAADAERVASVDFESIAAMPPDLQRAAMAELEAGEFENLVANLPGDKAESAAWLYTLTDDPLRKTKLWKAQPEAIGGGDSLPADLEDIRVRYMSKMDTFRAIYESSRDLESSFIEDRTWAVAALDFLSVHEPQDPARWDKPAALVDEAEALFAAGDVEGGLERFTEAQRLSARYSSQLNVYLDKNVATMETAITVAEVTRDVSIGIVATSAAAATGGLAAPLVGAAVAGTMRGGGTLFGEMMTKNGVDWDTVGHETLEGLKDGAIDGTMAAVSKSTKLAKVFGLDAASLAKLPAHTVKRFVVQTLRTGGKEAALEAIETIMNETGDLIFDAETRRRWQEDPVAAAKELGGDVVANTAVGFVTGNVEGAIDVTTSAPGTRRSQLGKAGEMATLGSTPRVTVKKALTDTVKALPEAVAENATREILNRSKTGEKLDGDAVLSILINAGLDATASGSLSKLRRQSSDIADNLRGRSAK